MNTLSALSALSSALALALTPAATADNTADLTASADRINALMRAHHYNPAELNSADYLAMETGVMDLARSAADRDAFIANFNAMWAEGPFSHVRLSLAQAPVAVMVEQIDAMRIGGGGAVLTWQGDTAILTVSTMMGNDTIEEIDAAYSEIAAEGANKLIIDLRGNSGGAFAVKPLVEHVINEPLEAGVFVSQGWNAAYDRAPSLAEVQAVDPWTGWSVREFWASAQSNLMTRIRFEPETDDRFDGPVFVLIDSGTQSAAEMAADALLASGRATLMGEATPGRMLSQTIYDVPGGMHLALPIADYYSLAHGRIEGAGVEPHERIDASDALAAALAR